MDRAATRVMDPSRQVVALVSGGRDSVCLLDLVVGACGPGRVTALHVNYGLRAGADGDEALCAEHCARLGVALEVVRADRKGSEGNLQAWARGVRYAAAGSLAERLDAVVATGHTAGDQAETVLYRLAASPGRRALLGMEPDAPLPVPGSGVRLVRPLLSYTREETTEHCRRRGLGWRDDPSNDGDAYIRGRVRGDLLRALGGVHPAAEQNVARTAELLRDEARALDEVVRATLDGDRIELARLRRLGPALRRLVVRRLAEDAAGALVPGAARRADEIVRLSERGTASLDIGGGVRAVVEYGVLRFVATSSPATAPEAAALAVPGAARFGRWVVRSEASAPDLHEGVLDRDALGPDLLVRGWRAGDRMAPLGLRGTKSLGDLFTAKRVPRGERSSLPVVEAGGEIAWVPGVATSELFRITPSTRAAVRITAQVSP